MEEWRAIPGYEGFYEVSDHGRVKSLSRAIRRGSKGVRVWPEKIMKLPIRSAGYPGVELYRDGKMKLALVHRLVCEVFHGPAPSKAHQVAHWDGHPSNNHADNLRWATVAENSADRARHGRAMTWQINHNTKLLPEQVHEIRKRAAAGEPMLQIAADYPCSATNVQNIVAGKSWRTL